MILLINNNSDNYNYSNNSSNDNNKDDNNNSDNDNSLFDVKFADDWISLFFHEWYFQFNNLSYEFEKFMWPNVLFYFLLYFFLFHHSIYIFFK